MSTTTARDVAGMALRVTRSALAAGVDVENWALITGSSTYGRQYKLVRRDPATGGERDIHLLGLTRTEAYRSLYGMAVAFELAAQS